MSKTLAERLRQAAQYTGLDSMRELLIEAAGALDVRHASDCAVHNEPAYPAGECNCNAEEDDFVIKRMSELLARIAIIVKGPEPALRRWSYHDLPELVAAAIAAAHQPQERKPLTDAEIVEAWRYAPDDRNEIKSAILFARSIEAAHGIKD